MDRSTGVQTWCETWSWFMRCRTSLQLSDAPLEIGRRRDAAAWTLLRFLGRSAPGSEVTFWSTLGSEVRGRLVLVSEVPVWSVAVVSPERSEGVSSADFEVESSAGSQANLPVESEGVSFAGSEVVSAVEAESLEGSEVSFLRQEA